jgi:phosphatidylglycerophosphatase A
MRASASFAYSHPAHFIAFGFGAGLAPFAPGTFGSLLAVPLWWVLGSAYSPFALAALIVFLFVVGVWACGETGRRLGVPDYQGMVWDEVVAFLLVLAIVPRELAWQLWAFVLFRFFDIVKPAPIRYFERRYRSGFGVMFDDLLAAGYTLLVLAIARRLL